MLFQQLSSFDKKIYCKETAQHAVATMCQFVHYFTLSKNSQLFLLISNNMKLNWDQIFGPLFYSYYTNQPLLAATPLKNWRTLLEQS